jgi:hypothetical protein
MSGMNCRTIQDDRELSTNVSLHRPGFWQLEDAHRGCFDLTQHQEHSGNRLDYFDQGFS